jgi:GNAT superfamily N-acetyltransferase
MRVRPATRDDLPAIVAMLAEDEVARQREDPSLPLDRSYVDAFEEMASDPDCLLVVLEDGGIAVGSLELTFLPSLTYRGRRRANVEAVRVRADRRGEGLGRHLMEWAITAAEQRGCHVVQLTTDRRRDGRPRAFYESLGFEASHDGMKLHLGGRSGG